MSSRTVRATQRNTVLKQTNNQTNKKLKYLTGATEGRRDLICLAVGRQRPSWGRGAVEMALPAALY